MKKFLVLVVVVLLTLVTSTYVIYASSKGLEFETINNYPNFVGQVEPQFPDKSLTSRVHVQNKRLFTVSDNSNAYFYINNKTDVPVESVDIYINNKLAFSGNLNSSYFKVDISNFVVDGDNMIHVENVYPQNSYFNINIPYPTIDTSIKSDDEYDFSSLNEMVEEDIENGFSGAQIAVIKDNQLILNESYGYSERYDSNGNEIANPTEVTQDTVFDIASNTKMYSTNLALMKLYYEGKIDLDVPIKTYLPDYSTSRSDYVTTRDLLTHQAGYTADITFFNNNENTDLFSQDRDTTYDLLMNDVEFEYGYHEKSVYSDIDYLLLTFIIEEITGQQLDEYVSEQIYTPLGLEHTMYSPKTNGVDNCAATEVSGNSRAGLITFDNIRTDVLKCEVHDEKAYYSMDQVSGHAGLFSTSSDMSVLLQLLLNGGGYGEYEIFDQATIDYFTQPSPTNETFGLGWRLAGQRNNQSIIFHFGPYASNHSFGHTGWTGTMTIVDPDNNIAIVLLTNKKHSPIDTSKGSASFKGDSFETGKYGSVAALAYETAILDNIVTTTDPVKPTTPVEPTDPTEPTEPTDNNDATDSENSTDNASQENNKETDSLSDTGSNRYIIIIIVLLSLIISIVTFRFIRKRVN